MWKAINLCNKYHFFIPRVISWATGVLLKRILACACILTCSGFSIAVSNFWVLHETLWFTLNWFVFMQNMRHKSSPVLHMCKSPFDPTLCRQLAFLHCMSMILCQKVGGCCYLCKFTSESHVTYHCSMCLSLPFCSYHSVYITVVCGIVFRWGIASPVLFILCRWLWLFGPIFDDFTWIFPVLRNIIESFEGKLNWIYRLLW